MLFRYSRLQYLFVLIVCVILLAGGVTGAVFAFNPSAELRQSAQVRERVNATREEIETLEASLADAGRPDFRQSLERARTQANTEHQARQAAFRELLQGVKVRADLLNRITGAQTTQAAEQARASLQAVLEGCPGGSGWTGYSQAACADLRAYAGRLADARVAERTAYEAFLAAEQALQNTSLTQDQGQRRLEQLQTQLASERAQLEAVSVFRLDWLRERLGAALALLASALIAVVIFVWISAIVIDVLNWIILVMRGLERDMAEKLDNARSDYSA